MNQGDTLRVAAVIPVLNEAESIAGVIASIPRATCQTIIVVDNGSTDGTADIARRAGATVVNAAQRGYGWAARAGCDAAADQDAVVFLDGDGSMPPDEIARLLAPIASGRADIVCGARHVTKELMPLHQRIGNLVIASMLRVLYGIRLRELGPFRAVRVTTLCAMHLPGSRFAWHAQMLARGGRGKARIVQVEVCYRERTGGKSKVGGSLRGSIFATWDLCSVLITERLR